MGGIGDVVRKMRHDKGWAQDELVRRSGVSKATIQNLEGGRYSPRQATLAKIATAFEVTPQDILIAAAEWGEDPLP